MRKPFVFGKMIPKYCGTVSVFVSLLTDVERSVTLVVLKKNRTYVYVLKILL